MNDSILNFHLNHQGQSQPSIMQPFFTGLGDDISNTDSAQNDAADEFGGLVIPPSLDLFVYSRADGKDPYDVVFEQMRLVLSLCSLPQVPPG